MRTNLNRFLFPLFILLVVSAGCDTTKKSKKLGESCEDDQECESGLCYFNKCLDPDSDDDMDTLTNANEKLIGTNPENPDSDGDGKDDFSEVGSVSSPNDTDGDGILDANESSVSDSDKDCLPEEFDPENGVPTENLELLKEFGCMKQGVCKDGFADIAAFCENGVLKCEYDKVADYEATETKCDDKDNDCNGGTDEGLTSTTEGECKSDGVCGAVGTVIDRKCEGGEWVCQYAELPDYEEKETKCDDKDNDCDGETDNGLANNDTSKCKKEGVCGAQGAKIEMKCENGDWVCDYSQVADYSGDDASCDNKDNDCEGGTDEDYAPVACELVNIYGKCAGMTACAAGDEACDAQVPVKEKCDNLDNNCNDMTDEGEICGKTSEVSGDVYNSSSQQPVQGASVSAYTAENCPQQFVFTDGLFPFLYDYMELYAEVQPEDWDKTGDQGNYTLYLKPGAYCVLVSAEG
ncbi:MAG: hypothetical protein FJ088_09735, partial [Deltaproteobacteria bacterium]|nr:hypothetical protein [Deltaproteobacteria bacterium]